MNFSFLKNNLSWMVMFLNISFFTLSLKVIDHGTWHAGVGIFNRFKTFALNKIKKQWNSFFFTSSYDILFAFNLGLLCFNPHISISMFLQSYNRKDSNIAKCIVTVFSVFFFKIFSLNVGILRKILVISVHLWDSALAI